MEAITATPTGTHLIHSLLLCHSDVAEKPIPANRDIPCQGSLSWDIHLTTILGKLLEMCSLINRLLNNYP